MNLIIGKTYEVDISDCCVTGEFTSKLIKAQRYDDDDNSYPVTTDEYGTEVLFDNGVSLVLNGGVSLEEVETD